MKTLKELLLSIYEGHCERLPDESDDDYLQRCGNSVYDKIGKPDDEANLRVVMKKPLVVPIPIKKK
jgi:hypothetical protein